MSDNPYNYAFQVDCWRHAHDTAWWAKVSPDTWRDWLIAHGWTHVEGKFYSGAGTELWQHSSELDLNNQSEDRRDRLKITGMTASNHWADYGRCVYRCVEQALGETSSWHKSVRVSRIGDVLYELLNAERPFAACVCIVDHNYSTFERSLVWSMSTKDGIGLPGGKIEPTEAVLAAAMRELYEESGVLFVKTRQLSEHHLYRTLDCENEIVDTFVFDLIDEHTLEGTFAGNGREGVPGWNPLSDLAKHARYGEYNRGLIEFVREIEWR
jgi:8-oxo-dGTP pyrophosphatase MutT (NUDIX family)